MFCSTDSLIDERYQIVTTIGQGGSGTVYLTVDLVRNRQLALKTLELNLDRQVSWGRFEREARIASRLNHPNIARVYDFGLLDKKVPYLVMELVHGQTLHERIKSNGPLTGYETLTVFKAMASALLYAHELNIIHRDIKPANIILTTDMHGEITGAKLIDFGLSKCGSGSEFVQSLTATGEVFGSPYYMSPEQWNGENISASADIYSLGVSLFEALSGTVPYQGENAFATAVLHITEPVPYLGDLSNPPENHFNWDLILQKMLAKNPEERYQSMADLRDDLNRLSSGQRIDSEVTRASSSDSSTLLAPLSNKNSKLLWVMISLVFLLLSAFATLIFYAFPSTVGYNTTEPEFEQLPIPGTTSSLLPHTVASDVTEQGQTRFYFPKNSMGKFIAGENSINASGVVIVPMHLPLKFTPSDLFLQQPHLFQSFRPNDLAELSIKGCPVEFNDRAMKYIGSLTGLKSLEVKNCAVTAKSIDTLNKLPGLTELVLEDTDINGSDLLKFNRLKELKTLEACDMTDVSNVLSTLKNNQHIKHLALNNDNLQNQDLKIISSLSNLEFLELNGNRQIDATGLGLLADLPKLNRLSISYVPLDSNCSKTLAKFKQLKILAISTQSWSENEVTALKRALPHCLIKP